MLERKKPMVSGAVHLFNGAGISGYGALAIAIVAFALYFCVSALSSVLAGLALFLGVVVSLALLPICVFLSQKIWLRLTGKRHTCLLVCLAALPLLNLALWSLHSEWAMAAKFFFVLISALSVELIASFYALNCSALFVELCGDSFERRKAYRAYNLGFLAGGCLLFLIAAAFRNVNFLDIGYAVSMLISVLGCVMFFVTFSHLPRLNAKQRREKIEPLSLWQTYKDFFVRLWQSLMAKSSIAFTLCLFSGVLLLCFAPFMLINFLSYSFHTASLIAAFFFVVLIIADIAIRFFIKNLRKRNIPFICASATTLGAALALTSIILYNWANVSNTLPIILCAAVFGGVGAGGISTTKSLLLVKRMEEEPREQRSSARIKVFAQQLLLFRFAVALSALIVCVVLFCFRFSAHSVTVLARGGASIVIFAIALGCLVVADVLFYKLGKSGGANAKV